MKLNVLAPDDIVFIQGGDPFEMFKTFFGTADPFGGQGGGGVPQCSLTS